MKELIEKFIADVCHAARKEIIAQIANGGSFPNYTANVHSATVTPFKRPVGRPRKDALPRVVVEPAKILELLPAKVGFLAKTLGVEKRALSTQLLALNKRGIVRLEGTRGSAIWHRS